MSSSSFRRSAVVSAVAAVTAVSGALTTPALAGGPGHHEHHHGPGEQRPDFTLTLLHGNDQESALLPTTTDTGETYAGAALFTELLQQQR
ncbi:hypothetical protein A7K94_0211870, partial [Modestobacter sp. VKM Ac-2676]